MVTVNVRGPDSTIWNVKDTEIKEKIDQDKKKDSSSINVAMTNE